MTEDASRDAQPSTDSSAVLEARDLRRRASDSNRWLLEGVSLQIHAGGRYAITGPSGSGKTLLLRALARLDPVDGGQVLWCGETVRGTLVPAFRRKVMYVHQRPALMDGSVEANLRKPFALRGYRDRRFDRPQIETHLRTLGRDTSFLGRASKDLSGGESQIVALLRAIQLAPRLLLLDEPTAALDPEITVCVEQLIDHWFRECPGERAIVWITHDRAQSERLADRVYRMQDGTLRTESSA